MILWEIAEDHLPQYLQQLKVVWEELDQGL